jgi:hypothetical protein
MSVPENIYINGKFVPNVNKVSVDFIKPMRTRQYNPSNWTGVTSCGKTPDEMYKYIFPK